MKRCPVILQVLVLVLGPGTAFHSTGAWAIPGHRTHSVRATASTPEISAAAPALMHDWNTDPDGAESWQEHISLHDYNCRQEIARAEHIDNIPTGRPCVETPDTQERVSFQYGRRVGDRGDILGEFDGVRVDYQLGDGMTLNGIAGYPALAAEDVFNPARQVFGISAGTDPSARTWDMHSYLIEQQENGLLTGRSMGGAIRYLKPVRSLLVYLDYDLANNTLGTLMASGALKLPFKTIFSATLDLQNRPIPDRQQNYLQHSMAMAEGWQWTLPADRLSYYTGEPSSEVSILSVGLSHALTQRIKLSGDLVVLDAATDSDAAASVQASEYFYHLKLSGKNLIIPGDRSKLDLRYSVTEDGRTNTATFDTRHTFKRFWNLISQLRADYFNPAHESRPRWLASPNIKMEYRRNKQLGFHVEAGGELSNGEDSATAESRCSYFVGLGYQLKF